MKTIISVCLIISSCSSHAADVARIFAPSTNGITVEYARSFDIGLPLSPNEVWRYPFAWTAPTNLIYCIWNGVTVVVASASAQGAINSNAAVLAAIQHQETRSLTNFSPEIKAAILGFMDAVNTRPGFQGTNAVTTAELKQRILIRYP